MLRHASCCASPDRMLHTCQKRRLDFFLLPQLQVKKFHPQCRGPFAALSRTQTRTELTGRTRVGCSPAASRAVKGISINSQAVRNDMHQKPAKHTHTETRMQTCVSVCLWWNQPLTRVPKGRRRDNQRQNLSYLLKQGNSSLTFSSAVLMLMTSSRNQNKERKVLCRWDGQK